MKNPAFKIWLESQLVLTTILSLWLFTSFAGLSIFGLKSSEIFIASILGFGLEVVFSLPAIPCLLIWFDQLKAWKISDSTIVALALAVYIPFLYLCARLLERTITGSWQINDSINEMFCLFTSLALIAAIIGLLINYERLINYVSQITSPGTMTE